MVAQARCGVWTCRAPTGYSNMGRKHRGPAPDHGHSGAMDLRERKKGDGPVMGAGAILV